MIPYILSLLHSVNHRTLLTLNQMIEGRFSRVCWALKVVCVAEGDATRLFCRVSLINMQRSYNSRDNYNVAELKRKQERGTTEEEDFD